LAGWESEPLIVFVKGPWQFLSATGRWGNLKKGKRGTRRKELKGSCPVKRRLPMIPGEGEEDLSVGNTPECHF